MDGLEDIWLPDAVFVQSEVFSQRERDLRMASPWMRRFLRVDMESEMLRPRHLFHYSRVLALEGFRRQERLTEAIQRLSNRMER